MLPRTRRGARSIVSFVMVLSLMGLSFPFRGGPWQDGISHKVSRALLQTARRWARPPCRHFKNQSCCCLGCQKGFASSPRRSCKPQVFRSPAPVESSRASPRHRPREDGLVRPADTSRTDLAAALGLLSSVLASGGFPTLTSHAPQQAVEDVQQPRKAHTTPVLEPLPKPQTKKFKCSAAQSNAQAAAFIEAKRKNGRFTACPASAWLHLLPTIWKPHQLTLVDIGCNKGYTSARLFGTFASHLNINSRSLLPHLRCVKTRPSLSLHRIDSSPHLVGALAPQAAYARRAVQGSQGPVRRVQGLQRR
jgi:hypothetical protein